MSFLEESKHKLIMFGALAGVFLIAIFSIVVPRIAASARSVDSNQSHASLQHTSYGPAIVGIALLTLKNNTLTIVVVVRGLTPGSVHAERIQAGICERQVPDSSVYTLNNLVVDKSGNAVSITVITNVKQIPDYGWYINIYRTTALIDKAGFDPIACGNVQNK